MVLCNAALLKWINDGGCVRSQFEIDFRIEIRYMSANIMPQKLQQDASMSKSAARLQKIRLELARTKEHPEGDPGTGYEFVAPLDGAALIDLESWRQMRDLCFVHRIENHRVVERGMLVHRAGGAGGATWAFDYDPNRTGDEEAGYRFGAHAFKTGEYVSIRDDDGDLHTYRVASVSPF